MRRLRDDHLNLTRRGADRPPKHGLRPLFAILFFVSAALLLLSRIGHPLVSDMRWRIGEWLTPLMSLAASVLTPVRRAGQRLADHAASSHEIERLTAENRALKAAAGRAERLERQLADLGALARIVASREMQSVAGRVVSTSHGAMVRTVTIDAGRLDGVRSGYPVVNGDGVVGRVVDAGRGGARVLLLSDFASRVPVVVGRDGVQAILVGDSGARPRLEFLADDAAIAEGDSVETSGVGGVYPRGLAIGRVVRDHDRWRVALHARLDALEFVSVLIFPTPLGDLDRDAVAAERELGGDGRGVLRGVR